MNKEKSYSKLIRTVIKAGSLMINFLALGLIYKVLEPVINWYLTKMPIRGIDTYLSAVYVNYIIKWGEYLRPFVWKYLWFGGYPLSSDYPSFYFLLMIPFVSYFGLIPGVRNFAILIWIIFAFLCYFFYLQLSKNKALSLILAIATILSANLYRALVWGGGIPFWTTQAFYPLVGFLLIRFLQSGNRRWFYLSCLATGLGIMGHPQGFLAVIIPFGLLALLLYGQGESLQLISRIKNVASFLLLSFLVGLPGVLLDFLNVIIASFFSIFAQVGKFFGQSTGVSQKPAETLTGTSLDILNWTHLQFNYVFSDTQPILWYLLGSLAIFWLITLTFQKQRRMSILSVLAFAIFLLYQVAAVFLYSRGIDLFIAGWYKAFWPIPIAASALVAVFWQQTTLALVRFNNSRVFKLGKWPLLVTVNVALLAVAFFSFTPNAVKSVIDRIDSLSSPSSPYPDILNVKITTEQRKELAQKLVPSFIDPNDQNKRLYTIDATVNLWWNSLYDMPLARGYVDPPMTNPQRWGLFWLDSVLGPSGQDSDEASLIVDWKTPKEVVLENTKFLLDWNAIYYLVGNYPGVVPNIFAKHVSSSDYVEAEEKITVQGGLKRFDTATDKGGEQWRENHIQELKYYKIKPSLVSPILSPNNASPVLLIGDPVAYDTIYRFLGIKNLNSQKVVVATKSPLIDDYSLSELNKFDVIILYRYDYRNKSKAWDLIRRYLEKGGKVYIDTGPEGKEAESSDLPAVLPFQRLVRKDIGRNWQVEIVEQILTKNVSFDQFSPLDFDGEVWNVSHPQSMDDLRPDAKVILKNNGKVVVASMEVGQGKLIWTGFNLPYHVIRDYNEQEVLFLMNILSSQLDLSEKRVDQVSFRFISPEEREITVVGSRAVLFKEENINWEAKSDSGHNLPIYQAGPTYPGFIYVPFAHDPKPQTVKLKYLGGLKWKIYHLISFITAVLLLDLILINGRLLTRPAKKIYLRVSQIRERWWQKDDEE